MMPLLNAWEMVVSAEASIMCGILGIVAPRLPEDEEKDMDYFA